MDDWLKILITFVLGFFTAIVVEPFRKRLLRASTKVTFLPKFGAGAYFISITPDIENDVKRIAKYVRVRVENDWWFTAKGCQAFLEKAEQEMSPGHYRTMQHDPLPLPWSHSSPDPRDIPPGMFFYFDVLMVLDSDNKLQPQSKPKPYALEELIRDDARYRFTAIVVGDNIKARRCAITLQWKGAFDSLTADCFDAQ